MLDDNQRRLVAGSLSGFTVRFLTQPFDVLKIRFQLQVEPVAKTSSSYYSGFTQAFHRIIKEEGLMALWKGHVPGQLLSMCFCGVEFAVFYGLACLPASSSSNASPDERRASSTQSDLFHGIVAGTVATVCCQPLDVMRTRLVAQGRKKIYPGFLRGLYCLIREEGLVALWRGVGPSCMLIAPQTAVTFAVYERLRRFYAPKFATSSKDSQHRTKLPPLPRPLSLLYGCIAGLVAKTSVYPLDLIKKRLSIRGFESARHPYGQPPDAYTPASYKQSHIYDTKFHATWSCFRGIVAQEGILGLYKGWVPSAFKAGFGTGLTFCSFEFFFQLLS